MAKRLNEKELKERAQQMLKEELRAEEVIEEVEVSSAWDSEAPDGMSYVVYIKEGYIVKGEQSHTIVVDNLTELKKAMSFVEREEKEEAKEEKMYEFRSVDRKRNKVTHVEKFVRENAENAHKTFDEAVNAAARFMHGMPSDEQVTFVLLLGGAIMRTETISGDR